ncbi:hypothetical protein K490DRAFT_46816 [Saccharata proteae CBS 121410]|uniref:Uncharacterized protein n=1 Tax=Saccharata proteae CBS 121410 TaxID=1314787 RepID=A0A9P4LTA6_9PEZI|nr:hypothetical protein K490DRAFT_46816 [Saccharata proteae CBS 121410]
MTLPSATSLATLFPADPRGPEYSIAFPYAGATLLALAAEKQISTLWESIVEAIGKDKDEALLTAARRVREAMLKASPLVGFPRSINGLSTLHATITSRTPTIAPTLASDHSLRSPVPKETRIARGKAFFAKIYAQHADRVLHSMNVSSGGDLGEFAITCIYGDLIAEESILDAKESAGLEFVCCLAGMAGPQAKGHMYGARNLGNSGKEIVASVELVKTIADGLGARFDVEGMEFVEKAKGW